MARVCPITWKRTSKWHNVSHSKRRTKRTFIPNLVEKMVFDKKLWRQVRLRISTSALRTLTKELVKNADSIYNSMKIKA